MFKFQGKCKEDPQLNLFQIQLKSLVSAKPSLVILSHKIDWQSIDQEFKQYYSKGGSPSVATRTMAGLLMLKSMFDQSDETLIARWVENPYWQYFCGEQFFRYDQPCDPSELVHFRKRIKKEGDEYLLKISSQLHGKDIEEKIVSIDTTIQDKNITFPTDAKLAVAILKKCWKVAGKCNVKLHQSYTRKTAQARLKLRFANHPKKKKEARKAIKDLRKYARKVIRQLRNQLSENVLSCYKNKFEFYERILSQNKSDGNKIYSLHEPDV